MTAEIRERLSDELDYEHEAQAQRAFARAWRGHPFVVVPDVVTSLSRERVLVTEWVEGIGFEEVSELPERRARPLRRDRLPLLLRLALPQRALLGRPPPGQLQADARRPRRVPRLRHDQEARAASTWTPRSRRSGWAWRATPRACTRSWRAMGFFDRRRPGPPARRRARPLPRRDRAGTSTDREVTLDRELVAQVLIDFGDPRSEHWELMKRETMPPDAMLARRMEALTLGVLGQLGATANWHRIAREWLFGDPPSTPLGEQEAEFFGTAACRGLAPAAARCPSTRAPTRWSTCAGRPGDGRAGRGARRRSTRRSAARPPGGGLRRAAALDRRPAAVDQGGAHDLRAADRPLRRPGARRPSSCSTDRPRGAARRRASRARRPPTCATLAEHVEDGELELDRLAELPDEEVIAAAHGGQGPRPVDGRTCS